MGIEPSFLPADAYLRLTQDPEVDVADGYLALERLRARKTPQELALVEQASTAIVDSMVAVFGSHGVGTTKHELVEALRREETARGLIFEYCLVSMGSSANRGASDQAWRRGDVLCLDSGGNLGGYIGDLARMAVLGEPDGELQDLLGHVDETQQAARRPIRPGARGEEIFHAADEVVRRGEFAASTSFVAHGMGLISHEAPRLTATGPVPYPNDHGDQPLEQGMVLSIETTLLHPTRGFIKLEDTVVVTDDGHRPSATGPVAGRSRNADLARLLRRASAGDSISRTDDTPSVIALLVARHQARRRAPDGGPELLLQRTARHSTQPLHVPCRREANDVHHHLRSPTPRRSRRVRRHGPRARALPCRRPSGDRRIVGSVAQRRRVPGGGAPARVARGRREERARHGRGSGAGPARLRDRRARGRCSWRTRRHSSCGAGYRTRWFGRR
ncbi:M24 family metallopeptidase [Pseudonocardia benzenivorans]